MLKNIQPKSTLNINEEAFKNQTQGESETGNRQETFITDVVEVQSESEVEEIIKNFQERFPFHTIHIEQFLQILFSLNKEKFKIEDLADGLKDKQWQSQEFYDLIQELPGTQDSGEIDIYSMICLGILWCKGDDMDKAQAFYQVVKNPSSGDKICFEPEEWEQIVPKLVYIASVFTYDQIEIFEQLRFDYDETLIQLAIPILQNSSDEGLVPRIFGEEEEEMLSKNEFINRLTQ